MSLGGGSSAGNASGLLAASVRTNVTFAVTGERADPPRDPLSPPPAKTHMSRDSLGGDEGDSPPPSERRTGLARHAQRQHKARGLSQQPPRAAEGALAAAPQGRGGGGTEGKAGDGVHAPPLHMPDAPPADAARLAFEWLTSLGIRLSQPWALETAHAPEFSDGLVLARAVEVCEHARLRSGIPGIEPRPRAPAAKLANIRRALEVLQGNRRMPLQFLWSEAEVREGDTGVILPLLLQMRHAYKHVKPVKAVKAAPPAGDGGR